MTSVLLGCVTLVAVVVLSSCTINYPTGGGMGSSAQRPADVNQSDVMFVAMMIPHHEQAVEMSDILLEKSGVDAEVRALAEAIKAAQTPEIEQMDAWLSEWGVNMGGGKGHGGGMRSDDDTGTLEDADGPSAAAVYLELMIPHHEDAIEMAEDVLSTGENADVRELAGNILESQTREIALMENMLASG